MSDNRLNCLTIQSVNRQKGVIMSYRVGTPNYNLPQTEGTDKRDWADTNQAFLTIDTVLKTASDNASSAGSAASAAQGSADAAMTAATNAQTAAGSAQTAAATAGELAQTAKSRADSAYTAATDAESNRGILKVLKTATGSSSKTFATLLSELYTNCSTAFSANKNIALQITMSFLSETRTILFTQTIKDNNFAFTCSAFFTGTPLCISASVRSSGSVFGYYNTSITTWTDMSSDTTAGVTAKLVCLG